MKAKTSFFYTLPKALIVAEVLVTLTLVFGLNAFCDEIFPVSKENAYGRLLLEKDIARCEAKVRITNPRMKDVRRAAAVAMLKGTFTKTYLQDLINGSVEDGITQKSCKVDL